MLASSVVALTACDLYGFSDDDDSPPDVSGSANILRNSDFEQLDSSGFAAQWENADDNPGGVISIVNDLAYSGTNALKYQITPEGDGYEFFIIQSQIDPALLTPGTRYELSGVYRLDRRGGDISFNYLLRAEPGADISNDWDNTHPAVEDSWEPFAWQFTIPGDASPSNYRLFLHLIKWTEDTNTLWVDDVSLHPAE